MVCFNLTKAYNPPDSVNMVGSVYSLPYNSSKYLTTSFDYFYKDKISDNLRDKVINTFLFQPYSVFTRFSVTYHATRIDINKSCPVQEFIILYRDRKNKDIIYKITLSDN